MSLLLSLKDLSISKNLTKLKLALLISFSVLMLFQFLVGFRDFDDYLIVFIFVLFLNDLFYKMTKPTTTLYHHEERVTRLIMSAVFLVLFSLPFALDSFNVSNAARMTVYKFGFVLWAQIFLLDSFLHYKQTHSKQWLVFTNTAALLILMGAFAV
jgi:hypothetical protein